MNYREQGKDIATLYNRLSDDDEQDSCNHGFASHVLVWLNYLGYIT